MDRYLNLVKLPASDLDAAGPKGFQAMLLGPSRTEQVCLSFAFMFAAACTTVIHSRAITYCFRPLRQAAASVNPVQSKPDCTVSGRKVSATTKALLCHIRGPLCTLICWRHIHKTHGHKISDLGGGAGA